MADTTSPERRSALMARIRSKDTQPEMAVRRLVHSLGYRYVLHDKRLPGKPDLVFPSRGKVIFVHGCFWHGHTCALASRPRSNADYWDEKISGNRARDARHRRKLRNLGWQVMVVRECAVQSSTIGAFVPRLLKFLEG